MKKLTLIVIVLMLAAVGFNANGVTIYGLEIHISPKNPSTLDDIRVNVSGEFSNGATLTNQQCIIGEENIIINLNYELGMTTMITPFSVRIDLGTLAANNYKIIANVSWTTWPPFGLGSETKEKTLVVEENASPTTWYVKEDGDDVNSGSSWEDAKATIQAAIDNENLISGDTVLVKYGTYNITSSIDFDGKNIKLASDDGTHNSYGSAIINAARCIIDAGENCKVFIFDDGETSNSVVDGFTITNGLAEGDSSANDGGGIYCFNSSPTITNNIITNNSAYWGGGIYCFDSSSKIINNIITNNSAYRGGGILCYVSPVTITNSTIVGNSASFAGGGIYCPNSFSPPTITNTILWNNNPEPIYCHDIILTYSDVQGSYTGEGNIDADPLFVDADNRDYHLQSGSPCIEAGTSGNAPETDIEGNPRDEHPDMGAYESTEFLTGDVNNDGVVDAKDATEILRHVVGLPPADQFIENRADVSKNGLITAYDAAMIYQKVAGLIDQQT